MLLHADIYIGRWTDGEREREIVVPRYVIMVYKCATAGPPNNLESVDCALIKM